MIDSERRLLADLVDANNSQRLRARLDHRRRMRGLHAPKTEREEPILPTSGRAHLRDDSSLSAFGFLLALFWLVIAGFGLWVLVLVFGFVGLLKWVGNLLKGSTE